MGRDYKKAKVTLIEGNGNGEKAIEKEVDFFAWEKLDYVDKIKAAFSI